MIREKRRRQRRMKNLLIGLLVFILLAVIAAFIVVKVFVVKTVKVEGNKLYDEQLITETVLNDEYSWNSLYVLLKYTFIDTDEVPFIDTMEVKLNSPSSLTIKVYEKGLLGYLYISSIDQMAYFDKDGFVVETSSRWIENVPKIEGITCEEVVLYEKLPIEEQQLRDLLTLTQTLKREKLVPAAINFGLDVSPVLYYDTTAIWLGSMELLTQKVERLNEILPSITGIEGVLHMENWTEETPNIIFEKAVQEPEEDADAETSGEGTEDVDAETSGEGTEDADPEATGEDTQDADPEASGEGTQDVPSDSPEMEDETPNAENDASNEDENVSNQEQEQ